MKEILFVCVNNVGRSQWAESIYNNARPGQAESAGTSVDEPDGFVGDWVGGPDLIIHVQNEEGPNIARNRRKQLTEDMLQKFGRVVVMAQPETWPNFIQIGGHIDQWEINDPVNMTIGEVRLTRTLVKSKVEELINGLVELEAQA
ncbi:hypothetical protein KW803_02575 [Candidatus Saccharibacteria bacterium]|nr:hypothetical protein [Candidatus Saccharibacteria bacterium]